MEFRTTFHRSSEALDLINSVEFVSQWKRLGEKQVGFCCMQEADILVNWYRKYASVFEPVIFTAFNESDELIGFLGMIWDEKDGELRHAGHPEYHGWLIKPGSETVFLKNVLCLMRDNFPIKKILWAALSPGLSIKTLEAALDDGMYISTKKSNSPLWDLTDEEKLKKFQKSRSLRSKFNRYNKRGELRFEVITDSERLNDVFKIVENQINFRHEAVNNVRPFVNDPIRIGLFVEQMKIPNTILPVSLWLDDQLLAFQLGFVSGDYVSLRMISFDPSESRQSPGTLLFIKMGEYLTENGFRIYDMTPGLNTYKDRFGNKMLDIDIPTIYFSKTSFRKSVLQQKLVSSSRKLVVEKMGVDINATRKWRKNLQELPTKVKKNGLGLITKVFAPQIEPIQLIQFDRKKMDRPTTRFTKVRKQAYEDLLNYQDTSPFITNRELLMDAQRKFAKGDVLYSVAEDGKLLWYVWQKKVSGEVEVKNQKIPIEQEGILLYDLYQLSSLNGKGFKKIEEVVPLLEIEETLPIYLIN